MSRESDERVDTAEQAAFRERVRAFLTANARIKGAGAEDDDELSDTDAVARAKSFQRAAVDAGVGGITYPVDYGGQGLDRRYQEIWTEEAKAYDLPTMAITISHGMCLPTLNDFGTPEQKAAHLSRIISAEEIWCQMFSEPGAGSDVASLQSRAERDGDEWVLNGQKVWTSGAHYSDYGLCVARTDPSLPKHQGLSMFMVPMDAPGVEVRPLVQITGDSDFNEVFFTDVRIPAANLVGELNGGWKVAVAMLMYERVALGAGGSGPMSSRRSLTLIDAARRTGAADDPVVRQAVIDIWIREQILGYVSMRIRDAVAAGRAPGPEGSIAKLAAAELAVDTAQVVGMVMGTATQAWDVSDPEGGNWARGIVGAPAVGIAGGTNEIQRNIIGERVLGLPKEPSVDKGVPFTDLLVGTQR